MSFLSKLFNKTAPLTIDQRIQALSAQDQGQLLLTLQTESDDAVRTAILKRLNFCGELYTFATDGGPLENTARKRIGELLDSGNTAVQSLSQQTNDDQKLLLTLCGYSKNAGEALIQEISDESTLVELGSTSGSPAIRQAVAEKLTSYEALTTLQKVVKTKDKSAYKIIKAKLDVFKQLKAEQIARNEQGQAVCSQAEQLVKRGTSLEWCWPNYRPKRNRKIQRGIKRTG